MNRKAHWESVYAGKAPDKVSWYQETPRLSLRLIGASGVSRKDAIIDVGGGDSVLVDCLLERGFSDVSVLDISGTALAKSIDRLGEKANCVEWIEADITAFTSQRKYDLWHDRAAFHFLTDSEDRKKYVAALKNSLAADGKLIIGGFAMDGPTRCSGLDVVRYDEQDIGKELGSEFQLYDQASQTHITPGGAKQNFAFFCFRRQVRGKNSSAGN